MNGDARFFVHPCMKTGIAAILPRSTSPQGEAVSALNVYVLYNAA